MKVLIIGQSRTDIVLFEHVTRAMTGVEAVSFLDARRALLWSWENQADLVLMDSITEGLDGVAFITQFRARDKNRTVPVLVVSSTAAMTVRLEALEAGATDFITTPYDVTELKLRIRNLLALREHNSSLVRQARDLERAVLDVTSALFCREEELIGRLSRAAEYRDVETGQHLARMAEYSVMIARNLGMSSEQQELILKSAPMHDIGKIGIPDTILLRPGKLSAEEYEIMKRHPEIGFRILAGSSSTLVNCGAEIARSHHEWWDGSGYPSGLAGEEIPIFGRICAVADVFDALTTERPYKPSWTLPSAVDFLRERRGTHFDPDCIDAFMEGWSEVQKIYSAYGNSQAGDHRQQIFYQ